jgi:hypothetical protein
MVAPTYDRTPVILKPIPLMGATDVVCVNKGRQLAAPFPHRVLALRSGKNGAILVGAQEDILKGRVASERLLTANILMVAANPN